MSISVSAVSRLVANVSQPRVALSRVVGGFELAFTVDGFSIPRIGQQPIIWIAPDLARISVGSDFQDVGSARPNHSLRVRTLPFSYEFRIVLSAIQLAAIEEVRSGGDLPYRLMISGITGDENDLAQLEMFQVVRTHSVPQSEWVQHLKFAKAVDILVLEIEIAMPRSRPTRFSSASIAGLLKRLAEDRDNLNKDQRRTTIEATVFHFGSLAAHDGAGVFDRRDARLALALTAALLAHELS